MITTEKTEHLELIQASIDYLKNKGFEDIKADVEGYDSPKSFIKKDSDVKITPDIVAYKAGRKHFFDVSIKSDQTKLLKSKWRLLDMMARLKDHRFKIITKRGHYKFTNEMLEDLNLDKQPIKLS